MITAYAVLGILLFPAFARILLAKAKSNGPHDCDLTDYFMSMVVGAAMALIWPFTLFILACVGGLNYCEEFVKRLLEKTIFRGL